MQTDHYFICRVRLGDEKRQQYRDEAAEAGLSLGDYLKYLMEDNQHLILGEDHLE